MTKKLKITFLGGVGEIGKNMTVIEYGGNIIVIDAGSMFPTAETPGIDLIIPDFSYLVENRQKLRGIFITHGHEDHIGALPFLLKEFPEVPVFGSKLTVALIEHKLKEAKITKHKTQVFKAGTVVNMACFSIEAIKVSHSIADALAYSVKTPVGVVFHTGDYKIDYTPVDHNVTDLQRIAAIGSEGVLLMLGESTNVERVGYTMSELTVGATLDKQFAINQDRRLIIATFASNVHRIQQIVNICARYGRKLVFSGRSMKKISDMAVALGELVIPNGMLLEIEETGRIEPNKLCIITTGSQGEPMSALVRMASGDDKIKITPRDTVIVSSSPIPGNEKMIYNVINNLYRLGAEVIYGSLEELHVSGHACREEIKLMLSLLKPKMFIPIHGEYRHLKQHAALAELMGVKSECIKTVEIGSQIEVDRKALVSLANVPAGSVFVDGETVGDVDHMIIRDRKQLSNDGFVIALITIGKKNKKLLGQPEIIARGFTLPEENAEELRKTIAESFVKVEGERAEIKASTRKIIDKYFFKKFKQRPMILPIIVDGD